MSVNFLTIEQLESMSKEALQAEFTKVMGTEPGSGTKPKLIEAILDKYEDLKKNSGTQGNGNPPAAGQEQPKAQAPQTEMDRFKQKLETLADGEMWIEKDGEKQKITKAAWENMTNKFGWKASTPNELKA